MIDKLLIEVVKRQRALEETIFSNPPIDMLDFNRRYGAWIELSQTAAWFAEALRKLDQDEEES